MCEGTEDHGHRVAAAPSGTAAGEQNDIGLRLLVCALVRVHVFLRDGWLYCVMSLSSRQSSRCSSCSSCSPSSHHLLSSRFAAAVVRAVRPTPCLLLPNLPSHVPVTRAPQVRGEGSERGGREGAPRLAVHPPLMVDDLLLGEGEEVRDASQLCRRLCRVSRRLLKSGEELGRVLRPGAEGGEASAVELLVLANQPCIFLLRSFSQRGLRL